MTATAICVMEAVIIDLPENALPAMLERAEVALPARSRKAIDLQ